MKQVQESIRPYLGLVILLTIAQFLSFVDRMLPYMLIEPIKQSLDLSDFQIGLINGTAFAILYVLFGLPLGWVIDRGPRGILLGLGILTWSLMTAAGAFSSSFAGLFAARLGVGLGEAVLTPCAVAMISDRVPIERRAKALGIFQSGAVWGTALTLIVGGPAIMWLSQRPALSVPGFGELETWQACFIFAGLPGVIVALFAFRLQDKVRERQTRSPDGGAFNAFTTYVRCHWAATAALIGAGVAYTMLINISTWKIALFQRVWRWDVGISGPVIGVADLIGNLAGIWLAVALNGYWLKKFPTTAPMRSIATGLAIAMGGIVSYPLMPDPWLAVVFSTIGSVGITCCTASGLMSISTAFPGLIRGQATAVYFLGKAVGGMAIGPPLVGFIVDQFGYPEALRFAIPMVALGITPIMIFFIMRTMPSISRAVEAASNINDRGGR